MNQILFKILILAVLSFTGLNTSLAQQRKMNEAQKKKEKVERSYKKAYARARKQTIKHRRSIQTDATKERMDAADKRAEAYNSKDDPAFFERFFKKKRHRKR